MQQLGNMKDNFDDLSDPEQFACMVSWCWCYTSGTEDCVWTHLKHLKQSCLAMWSNTVVSVWFILSVEKLRRKRRNEMVKIHASLYVDEIIIQTQSLLWFRMLKVGELLTNLKSFLHTIFMCTPAVNSRRHEALRNVSQYWLRKCYTNNCY